MIVESSAVVELCDVWCRYPTSGDVLRSVNLTISRGELVAIVGPSGSGKSTLLQIMGTLERPTRGEVVVGSTPVSALSDRQLAALRARSIGFVFQQFFLLDGMSALENVATALLYSGLDRAARIERARQALDQVQLSHRLNHRAIKLSGGEQQRVAIARALASRPAFILADEPTGNLDSHRGAEILDLLTALNQQGTTIVLITHDLDIANSLPRQIELRDGEIIADRERVAA
jgi:putative ABC transport system ATP-binding protein